MYVYIYKSLCKYDCRNNRRAVVYSKGSASLSVEGGLRAPSLKSPPHPLPPYITALYRTEGYKGSPLLFFIIIIYFYYFFVIIRVCLPELENIPSLDVREAAVSRGPPI